MWVFPACPALRNIFFLLHSGHYYFIHETYFSHHESKLDLYAAMQHHSPVSSILLQENRIQARRERAFFFAALGVALPILTSRHWYQYGANRR